jgi:hypothetical protein
MTVWNDEETTRNGLARPLHAVPPAPESAPPDADLHQLVGRLMAACSKLETNCARLERKVDELTTLPGEVAGLRADIEKDRKVIIHDASAKTAAHTSNRMAALLGALFTVYEIASPYFHGIWGMFHK